MITIEQLNAYNNLCEVLQHNSNIVYMDTSKLNTNGNRVSYFRVFVIYENRLCEITKDIVRYFGTWYKLTKDGKIRTYENARDITLRLRVTMYPDKENLELRTQVIE